MANRNKLSMLKAVFKDLEVGLKKENLSYEEFEKFGELLSNISMTYEVAKKNRRVEKLTKLKAEKEATEKLIADIEKEIEADKK